MFKHLDFLKTGNNSLKSWKSYSQTDANALDCLSDLQISREIFSSILNSGCINFYVLDYSLSIIRISITQSLQKILLFFFFLNENICYEYSFEAPRRSTTDIFMEK